MRRRIAILSSAIAPFLLAAAPATQPAPVVYPPPVYPAPPVAERAPAVAPQSALARKLPEISFKQIHLADAIDFLRDVSGANIHVNWRALEGAGVTQTSPVTMQLSGVPMRRILRSLLDECGGPTQLTYYVDQGVIEITTREMADSQMITRVYPVEDLVLEVPNFTNPPTFDLQNQTNQASGGGGGGGGSSQSLFGGNGSGAAGGAEQTTTKLQRANALVQTIEQTIHPEIWRDNGGTASIRYFNGHLIVTAPRSIQEAIGGKP